MIYSFFWDKEYVREVSLKSCLTCFGVIVWALGVMVSLSNHGGQAYPRTLRQAQGDRLLYDGVLKQIQHDLQLALLLFLLILYLNLV
jgi:hypothetical protein